MKKVIPLFLLLIGAAARLTSTPEDFPRLTGPYLGQRPPGVVPELFAPDIISTGLNEGIATFMPAADEIVFMVIYRKPHSQRVFTSLVTSRVNDGVWSAPQLMEFSDARYDDACPFISYDGKELFFQSNRPTNTDGLGNEWNIWRCQRAGERWSNPAPLPSPVNGRGDVSGPSMSKSGVLFFTRVGPGSASAVYRSSRVRGKYSEPERLPECVNKDRPFDGVIAPDGRSYIVCAYDKEDSLGGTDLYVTFMDENGGWSPLINLGKGVNTKLNEGSATISPDGKYLFFSGFLVSHDFYSDRMTYADILNNSLKPQYGNSDIYWVSAEIVRELNPKPVR
jgi:hypothetical protein